MEGDLILLTIKIGQRVILSSIVLFFLGKEVLAKTPIDKSNYTLFNPVPEDMMREMSTDRPDKTEGAITIDPGHLQVEFDILNIVRDHTKLDGDNTKTKSYTIFAPNFRVGLTDKLEADFIFSTYTNERIKDLVDKTKVRHNGFGDLVVRVKYNFWGNEEEEQTAFGIIPYLKFPTNHDHLGNEHVEGGVLLPLCITITEQMGLGLMTGLNIIRGENHHEYYASFPLTGSLAFNFTEKLCGFVEVAGEKSTEPDSHWDVTLDLGTTYLIHKNLQVDASVNIGLTKAADDFTFLVGMAFRV